MISQVPEFCPGVMTGTWNTTVVKELKNKSRDCWDQGYTHIIFDFFWRCDDVWGADTVL